MKRLDSGQNFARFALGELTIVALRDGYVDMPTSRLRQPGGLLLDLPTQVNLVDGKFRLSVNVFLIIDHDQHVLIDTGASNAWEPTMGSLLNALAEAGVARDEIRTVALTHTHEDHVNGLVAADGSDAFPKLDDLLVPEKEIARFDKEERLARFRLRRAPLKVGRKLTANITALQAHGHEVGHTAFEVSSGGATLLIWGDIVHVPSIQFARPEITWELDADQNVARSTRQRMLRAATRANTFVAGAHLDFPGVGKVVDADNAFSFIPL